MRLRRLTRAELAEAKALVGREAVCLESIASRGGTKIAPGEVVEVRGLSRGGKVSIRAGERYVRGVDYRKLSLLLSQSPVGASR